MSLLVSGTPYSPPVARTCLLHCPAASAPAAVANSTTAYMSTAWLAGWLAGLIEQNDDRPPGGPHGREEREFGPLNHLTPPPPPDDQLSAWHCPTRQWGGRSGSQRCLPASTDGRPPPCWVSTRAGALHWMNSVVGQAAFLCVVLNSCSPQRHRHPRTQRSPCPMQHATLAHACSASLYSFRRLRIHGPAGQSVVHPALQGLALVSSSAGRI